MEPWNADGLRFECTRCGNCCRNHGEYAWVYLMPPEVEALAALLGLDEAAFLERWCQVDEGWTVLRMDEPECPFLTDEGTCGVYAARPMQCRTWPFWEENLQSPETWAATRAICPGIGSGPRIEWQEAAEIARRNEQWYGAE